MRRLSGWMCTGAACMAMAGCSPDLTVTANYKPQYTCVEGQLGLRLLATITNQGPGVAVLPEEWTQPWVTAFPSVPIPLFVQPFQTLGKSVTLNPGDSIPVNFDASLPPVPGGGAYDLIIRVDPYNVIAETNENNNTGKIAIPDHICG